MLPAAKCTSSCLLLPSTCDDMTAGIIYRSVIYRGYSYVLLVSSAGILYCSLVLSPAPGWTEQRNWILWSVIKTYFNQTIVNKFTMQKIENCKLQVLKPVSYVLWCIEWQYNRASKVFCTSCLRLLCRPLREEYDLAWTSVTAPLCLSLCEFCSSSVCLVSDRVIWENKCVV